MTLPAVTLDDKYTLRSGRIYLSGVQALVRLPIMQRERDKDAGLNTGGFISGYRGSPLGVYDNALWQAKRHLEAHNVRFQPGLNEDLAATAVWGSQQVNMFPGAAVDGVFAIWYGKGPGVDRSTDALKHGNTTGSSKFGGVLAIAGDDHGCQSSTLAHQSEQIFQAAMMPILNPANIREYLEFGLYGFELSRFSGCWVGIRVYKVGLTWPLEPSGAQKFAEGLQDVLVVEEKRGFIEQQLVHILYNMDAARRPTVVGKTDESGAPLLPSQGELTPSMVAR